MLQTKEKPEASICYEEDNVSSHDNSVSTQKEPVTENIPSPTMPTEPIMATENMLDIELKGKKRQKIKRLLFKYLSIY